jgi:hypothetical protein
MSHLLLRFDHVASTRRTAHLCPLRRGRRYCRFLDGFFDEASLLTLELVQSQTGSRWC